MDEFTGLTILGSAIGGKNIVEKILGPTAEYIGVGLKNWTENRVNNVKNIFEKAGKKLGEKINQDGSVPPRVLKEILDEGSYCEDELMSEYFAGVLASSRSKISRDDRASSYLKIISGLSSYQILFHYISYTLFRNIFLSSKLRPTFSDDINKMGIFIPSSYSFKIMEIENTESFNNIMMHCVSGLERQNLLLSPHHGERDFLNEHNKNRGWIQVNESGHCIIPTQYGIDLYMWAIGLGMISFSKYLDQDIILPSLPKLIIPDGPVKLYP